MDESLALWPILQEFDRSFPDLVLISSLKSNNRQSVEAALAGCVSEGVLLTAELPIEHYRALSAA